MSPGAPTGLEAFTVEITAAQIADLTGRLEHTRWPDQLPGTAWGYGTDLHALRGLCRTWQLDFDWSAARDRLNRWPQWRTTIDAQRIHFIHARSARADAIPLLVLHGWPGSVAEMLALIGPLTDPEAHGGTEADSFHVVCPSLPGFGFSGPTTEAGWHPRRMAAAMAGLMERLGYTRFATLGGDWGATVSNYLGLDAPEKLIGIYLTMVAAGPPSGSDGSELTPDERRTVNDSARFFTEEVGYLQIQGTRPQTLAYSLTDSPAGLAGWMLEKFRAWSDCNGELSTAISVEDLLTNLSVYWLTSTAGSAARIYYEAMHAGQFQPIGRRIEVPTGCALFPKETVRSPRAWAEAAWNLRHWSEMPRGGHFPALEVPELLVADVRRFYRLLRV